MDPGFHRGDDKAGMTEKAPTSSRHIQRPSAWSQGRSVEFRLKNMRERQSNLAMSFPCYGDFLLDIENEPISNYSEPP
jgi:hypothetical protein